MTYPPVEVQQSKEQTTNLLKFFCIDKHLDLTTQPYQKISSVEDGGSMRSKTMKQATNDVNARNTK